MSEKINVQEIANSIIGDINKRFVELVSEIPNKLVDSMSEDEKVAKALFEIANAVKVTNERFVIDLVQRVVDELQK